MWKSSDSFNSSDKPTIQIRPGDLKPCYTFPSDCSMVMSQLMHFWQLVVFLVQNICTGMTNLEMYLSQQYNLFSSYFFVARPPLFVGTSIALIDVLLYQIKNLPVSHVVFLKVSSQLKVACKAKMNNKAVNSSDWPQRRLNQNFHELG